MTKIFNRLSVRELVLLLGVSLVSLVSLVGVVAQSSDGEIVVPENGIKINNKPLLPNPTCFDNYDMWPVSNAYKKTEWSMSSFVGGSGNSPKGYEQFLDINGDGLVDYLYSTNFAYFNGTTGWYGNYERTCILLNNGAGWDIVHRCISHVVGLDEWLFYGDCADTEKSTL